MRGEQRKLIDNHLSGTDPATLIGHRHQGRGHGLTFLLIRR
ncbi:hypothetical protein [Kribbella sp. CCNWLW197]